MKVRYHKIKFDVLPSYDFVTADGFVFRYPNSQGITRVVGYLANYKIDPDEYNSAILIPLGRGRYEFEI